MNNFVKFAAAAAMTGALALSLATPSEARDGRNAAAIGGFAAGAVVGAAVAGSANNGYYADRGGYYGGNRGYYAEPGYAYEGGYAYRERPAYYYDQAAVPAYPYEAAPRTYRRSNNTANCGGSPGAPNYRPCGNQ